MSRWCVCPSPPALVPKVSPHQTNSKQRLTWALVRHCSKEQFRSGKIVGSRLCYISTRQHSRIQAGMGYCAAGWLYKVIAFCHNRCNMRAGAVAHFEKSTCTIICKAMVDHKTWLRVCLNTKRVSCESEGF